MDGVLAQREAALATKGLKRGDRTALVVLRYEEQRLGSEILSLQKQIEATGADETAATQLLTTRRGDLQAKIDELLVLSFRQQRWLEVFSLAVVVDSSRLMRLISA